MEVIAATRAQMVIIESEAQSAHFCAEKNYE